MGTLSQIAAVITESSNLIGTSLKFFFQWSSYMGRNLVNYVVYVFDCTNRAYQLTAAFAGLICEDFLVFYQDLAEKFDWLVSVTVNGISTFVCVVTGIFSYIFWFVTKTINFTFETGKALVSALFFLVSFVKACLTLIRDLFLLIGSSVWLAVTKLPTAILSCFIWIFSQLLNFLQGILLFSTGIQNAIVSYVKDIFNNISTVYTSFLGLLICFILLYCIVKNWRTVTSPILNISKKMYCSLSSFCYNCWCGLYFDGSRQDRHEKIEVDKIIDKLCIICLDRPKDMLIMRCYHLCLCNICGLSYDKNLRCPLCRSQIEEIVKVYF